MGMEGREGGGGGHGGGGGGRGGVGGGGGGGGRATQTAGALQLLDPDTLLPMSSAAAVLPHDASWCGVIRFMIEYL